MNYSLYLSTYNPFFPCKYTSQAYDSYIAKPGERVRVISYSFDF